MGRLDKAEVVKIYPVFPIFGLGSRSLDRICSRLLLEFSEALYRAQRYILEMLCTIHAIILSQQDNPLGQGIAKSSGRSMKTALLPDKYPSEK